MNRDLTPREYYDVDASERQAALDRQADYAAAESWAYEVAAQAQASRRTAWAVAIVMIVICAAQAAAIALMLPLKEVVPYTLLVDRTSGYVETVRGLKLGSLPEDKAVTNAFLAQYVLARETVDTTDLKDRYRRVALWSDGAARTDYVNSYILDNPEGVLATLGPDTRVNVIVKDIVLTNRDSAAVRFDTVRRSADGIGLTETWRAVLTFRYSGAPMRTEDRLINPLGFQVLAYRRDAETLGDAVPPVADEAISAPDEENNGQGETAPPARAAPKLSPALAAKAQAAPTEKSMKNSTEGPSP
jgi:type IV secretion system protein VirB8